MLLKRNSDYKNIFIEERGCARCVQPRFYLKNNNISDAVNNKNKKKSILTKNF